MAEPPHPGTIAARAIRHIGLTPNAAAAAMGTSAQALGKVLGGKSALSPAMALRIAALLGSEAEMWLKLQADYDLWHARRAMKSALAKIKRAETVP